MARMRRRCLHAILRRGGSRSSPVSHAGSTRRLIAVRFAGKGRTIAVMGTGLDTVYPRENTRTDVARYSTSGGCLVTQFPLGTPPIKENFPYRNRIISGLSLGVLIVEASERSGSLITARLAPSKTAR